MKPQHKRAARIAAIAAAVIVVPSPVAAVPSNAPLTVESGVLIRHDVSAPATPSATPFLALQLNLCDSGLAACYQGGKSIPEAFNVILNTAPSLVTLNEVCEQDVRTSLSPAIARMWPNEWVFWAFMPARDRDLANQSDQRYRCKNGDVYGIGMLGRLFTTSTPVVALNGDIYPSDRQDPDSDELRAWMCVDANHSYWGCTTHLREGGGQIALDQCDYLTKQVVPSIHAAHGYHPTVLGGDLNLRFQPGNQFNVQQCVPSGWFRKGDGDVQHTMATNDFTFNRTRGIHMDHTDHPAWAVTLTKS